MKKTLVITIRNTFNDKMLLRKCMPIERDKARFGEYSSMWKTMRQGFATHEKVSKEYIRASVEIINGFSKRIILTTENGFQVDMPADCSVIDLKILKKHLEAKSLELFGIE